MLLVKVQCTYKMFRKNGEHCHIIDTQAFRVKARERKIYSREGARISS